MITNRRQAIFTAWALVCGLFFASPLLASPPDEIPGNGFNESGSGGSYGSCSTGWYNSVTGSGCDKKLPGHDADNDGFTDDGSEGWWGREYATLATGSSNSYLGFVARKGGAEGNDIRIAMINPGSTHSLAISVAGSDINITLAYSAGAITSTAAQIADAIEANSDASALVWASLGGGTGASIVSAVSQTNLAGGVAGSTATDCEPNDPMVYLNKAVACDTVDGAGTGWKVCQSDGTYSTCIRNSVQPYCPATGSGICKYVGASGSNSNPGTFASPYATLGKVSGGAGGSVPSSPYTLQPGDRVLIVGNGDLSTTFDNGFNTALAYFSADGTSSNWIGVIQYPGALATFTNTSGAGIQNLFGDYYIFDGLRFSGADSADSGPIRIQESAHHRLERILILGAKGQAANNFACISFAHTSDSQVRNAWLKDCKRYTGVGATGNADNITAINWLDNHGDSNGGDHGGWNVNAFWSSYSDTDNGDCFRMKHGVWFSDCGLRGHPIEYSSCYKARRGLQWQSSCLRYRRNMTIFDASDYVSAAYFFDSGEAYCKHQDNLIDFSTFVNGGRISWSPATGFDGSDRITVKRSIFIDKGSIPGDQAFLSIMQYGNDTQYGQVWATDGKRWNSNELCQYSADDSYKVIDFTGTSPCDGTCTSGQNYTTLSSWRAAHGQDVLSFFEDPDLDSNWSPQNANCSSFGRMAAEPEGGESMPESTPLTAGRGGGLCRIRGKGR